MFIGHFSIAYLLNAFFDLPFALSIVATEMIDIVFELLIFVGIEYPTYNPLYKRYFFPFDLYIEYSHSLVPGVLIAGIIVHLLYKLFVTPRRNENSTMTILLLYAMVVSHYVADWIFHRPDVPIIGKPLLDLFQLPALPYLGMNGWDRSTRLQIFLFEYLPTLLGIIIFASQRYSQAIHKKRFVYSLLVPAILGALVQGIGCIPTDDSKPPQFIAPVIIVTTVFTLSAIWTERSFVPSKIKQ
jgi:hypothetical protein